ncbi:MAG: nitrate reductase molybdenum cofactor assembly chaperone [Rhodocyclaceae bacterium]|jgi:nitrate reductase delta subunit|nr:nitrate reductase molybdenum cofactor assembly chaperone [Rhodocyclaceae bacterium]
MQLYKLLSYLLDYPAEDLYEHLPELRVRAAEAASDVRDTAALEAFLDFVSGIDALELQRHYVETFDLKAQHSLHLTHHLLGDDKNRGPALIDLGEYYKAWGMKTIDGELPDYLPLMFEFAATLEEMEGRMFLSQFGKVLTVLAGNLEKSDNPWAPLVRIGERRALLMQAAA